MKWARTLHLVGCHAEGEIGRTVMGGFIEPPGATILDKLVHLNTVDDDLRRFAVFEPRGYPTASVNLLLKPCDTRADAGFVVLQPDRAHAMSGSNAICVTTALLETGVLPMREPETIVTLDTAAGLVRARATCEGGRCRSVRLAMPASYVEQLDVAIEVPSLGRLLIDIAFGGVFYALVDSRQIGLEVNPGEARRLVEIGMLILQAAQASITPVHPERPGLEGIAYLMWCERAQDGVLRNATVMPPGRLDRSPCGTGSSARLAVMHRRGEIAVGARMVFHSTIGTRFEALVTGTGTIGRRPSILPEIAGRGWLHSFEQIGWDPEDPFPHGHALSDVWGPGVGG